MAEMAEIFPLFRYYSVSSVIDKDNSQSDWRKEKHAAWPFCYFCHLASPKAPTVGSAGNKIIVSSVRDKNNSHGDWREDIFYNGRNGNYRKINGKGYVFRIK